MNNSEQIDPPPPPKGNLVICTLHALHQNNNVKNYCVIWILHVIFFS